VAEASLLERASELECELQPSTAGELSAGLTASAACSPQSDEVGRLTLRSFEDPDTLLDSWQAGPAGVESLAETWDACETAEPGTRTWSYGNVACVVEDGLARITWTDERIDTLGVIEGTSDDMPALFEWWRSNGRRIGRADEPGPSATPTPTPQPTTEPEPSKKKPLVRVPGAPRSLTCTADQETILDEWDRTWRLRTIDFLDRDGYERVVINLVRTGKNRTDEPTRALFERMSFGRLRELVPNAPVPRRGRVAIVLRLDGLTDAPNLRAYRPSGTSLLRELSVVRSGGAYTVVLSSPKGTCYQARVPIFGSNAKGTEQRAQIYVDLKQGSS
jgi:hypothetical protein